MDGGIKDEILTAEELDGGRLEEGVWILDLLVVGGDQVGVRMEIIACLGVAKLISLR